MRCDICSSKCYCYTYTVRHILTRYLYSRSEVTMDEASKTIDMIQTTKKGLLSHKPITPTPHIPPTGIYTTHTHPYTHPYTDPYIIHVISKWNAVSPKYEQTCCIFLVVNLPTSLIRNFKFSISGELALFAHWFIAISQCSLIYQMINCDGRHELFTPYLYILLPCFIRSQTRTINAMICKNLCIINCHTSSYPAKNCNKIGMG